MLGIRIMSFTLKNQNTDKVLDHWEKIVETIIRNDRKMPVSRHGELDLLLIGAPNLEIEFFHTIIDQFKFAFH